MELKHLENYVRTLAQLKETEAPVTSCYLELSNREYRNRLDQRVRELNGLLAGDALSHFQQSMSLIEEYVAGKLEDTSKGVALFSRGGHEPFFLALQFRVPLPTWLSVDTTPNIYHLVEMKDTYHRYIVLIASEERARIVEVNLGAVTRQLWVDRSELRQRVGREWSKEHYQNHRRERSQQFLREKIKLLERLMPDRGYSHLVLAGSPQVMARVRKALPKSLANKVVDVVPASSQDKLVDVVDATLAAFIEQEEKESLALSDELLREIRTGGLAVVGNEEVLAALRKSQADALVISASYDGVDREDMVRLAEQGGCRVEVVNTSEPLERLGGVGALLRYRDY
jgi:protein required for attachment to host cells